MLGTVISFGKFLLRSLVGFREQKENIELEKYKEDAEVHKTALEASVEVEKISALQKISDNANKVTRWIRPAFAFLVWFYIGSIVLVSTVLQGYHIEKVPAEIEEWMRLIILFYFAGRPVEKIIDKWSSK